MVMEANTDEKKEKKRWRRRKRGGGGEKKWYRQRCGDDGLTCTGYNRQPKTLLDQTVYGWRSHVEYRCARDWHARVYIESTIRSAKSNAPDKMQMCASAPANLSGASVTSHSNGGVIIARHVSFQISYYVYLHYLELYITKFQSEDGIVLTSESKCKISILRIENLKSQLE